jgi:hypothetical protein
MPNCELDVRKLRHSAAFRLRGSVLWTNTIGIPASPTATVPAPEHRDKYPDKYCTGFNTVPAPELRDKYRDK